MVPAPPAAQEPAAFRFLLTAVLRGGVLASAGLLILGMALGALHGGLHASQVATVRATLGPRSLVSLGLVLLIALPVARVALSLAHFVREKDRLYIALTATVLVILLGSIVSGKAL